MRAALERGRWRTIKLHDFVVSGLMKPLSLQGMITVLRLSTHVGGRAGTCAYAVAATRPITMPFIAAELKRVRATRRRSERQRAQAQRLNLNLNLNLKRY